MTKNPNGENTDVLEFRKFHELLLLNAPKGYKPYLFVCQKKGKDPLPGISWKKMRVSFEKACSLMERGYNIGVAGTDLPNDYLCIMDVDDLSQVQANEIKMTLEITSRKRIGRHYYYFSMDKSAKMNIATGDAGELRSVWQYVLAPGSYVPCSAEEKERMPDTQKHHAGKYQVTCAIPTVELSYDELPYVYRRSHIERQKSQEEQAKLAELRKGRVVPQIIKYRSALWDLSIRDVSGMADTGYRKVPMPSEIHGSETGHNCSVSNGLLHCWRHNVAHCPFSYLGVLAGIGSCEQLGKPHGGGSYGIDFQDGYTIFTIWKYAKDNRYIPEDDPIPHAALIYYALSRRICTKKQLTKEGRLPAFVYSVTPAIAKTEGINLGRQ